MESECIELELSATGAPGVELSLLRGILIRIRFSLQTYSRPR